MNNHVSINGKYYAIDLEKLIEFCGDKQNVSNTITQTYGQDDNGKMVLLEKEVGESTDSINEVFSTYRYNTITNILNLIMIPISDGTGNVILTEDFTTMHFGQKLAFNTLVEMGIIYEIDMEN